MLRCPVAKTPPSFRAGIRSRSARRYAGRVTLDTRPLTEPLDRAGLRAFRRSLPAEVRPPLAGVVARAVLVIGFPLLFLGFWLFMLDGSFVDETATGGTEWDWAMTIILLPYVAVPVVGVVLLVRAMRRRRGVRQFRLDRFARANGFAYSPYVVAPALPGMIFTRDGARSSFATDVVVSDSADGPVATPFEVGNHTAIVGSGKNSTTYRWGYAALRLPTPLPHIVLDARANNTLRRHALPVPYAAGQRLSLEGDFDSHFTLYCPAGYERDALYLFSPDVMARFVDSAASLDVEIVDDHLLLYSPRPLSNTDPENWTRLTDTVDALAGRIRQWERWRESHASDAAERAFGGLSTVWPLDARPGVAPRGRRLARRADWWWLVGAALAVFGFYRIISDAVADWSG